MKHKERRKSLVQILIFGGYAIFLGFSWLTGFKAGQQIGENFFSFAMTMLKMLPAAFLLISLFEVWVKRETVEKYLGNQAGFTGYLWAILLAGTIVGPLYVALPVANALHKKGARLGVVFTYIGASALCRVPMTIFEATFLGAKFTAIRFIVSLPLVVVTSILLERYLISTDYSIVAEP